MPGASALVTYGISGLAVLMGALFVYAVQRARSTRAAAGTGFVVLVWFALTWGIADAGMLARFDVRPPPMMLMLLTIFAVAFAIGMSKLGRDLATLPLGWLVLAQSFRLPLELVMHQAAVERVMPVEMSYSGYNFDIVTGATAILVGVSALRERAPRWLLIAWNAYGALCLVVIAVVAFASSPIVRAFGDEPEHLNTWVLHPPFVWLPTVLVVFAVAGHVVVARRLRANRTLPDST